MESIQRTVRKKVKLPNIFLVLNGLTFGLLALVVAFAGFFAVSWAHNQLVQEYLLKNGEVLKGVTDSKRSNLRRFSKTHEDDANLSHKYFITSQNGDVKLTEEELNKLKETSEVDRVDIISPQGNPLTWKELGSNRSFLKEVIENKRGIRAIEVDKTIYLISYSPLRDSDLEVGSLVVALALNNGLEENMAKITNAKFRYFLQRELPENEAQQEKKIIKNLGYKSVSGKALRAKVTLDSRFLENFKKELALVFFVVSLGVFLLVFLPGQIFLRRKVILPMISLSKSVEKAKSDLDRGIIQEVKPTKGALEISLISKRFSDLLESFKDFNKKEIVREVTEQVHHDVRSQIATLGKVLEKVRFKKGRLTDKERYIVNNCFEKIDETLNETTKVAEAVLEKGPVQEKTNVLRTCKHEDEVPPQLISSLVRRVVEEKRFEVGNSKRIDFAFESSGNCWIFAKVVPLPFSRALSNLINNSVEAIECGGKISVRVSSGNDSVSIIDIRDNGKGIPPQFLDKLGTRGWSHGKPAGNGLGFSYAKDTLESWGGNLTVRSTVGEGTEVRIWLPTQPAPSWCVSEILLPKGGTVVILDDDPTIHSNWEVRFDQQEIDPKEIRIKHFKSASALLRWHADHPEEYSNGVFYLCDLQLTGQKMTGLDVISKLEIHSKSVLVTNYYDKKPIQTQCEYSGLRLMPKDAISRVTIRLVDVQPPLKLVRPQEVRDPHEDMSSF